MKQRSILIVDDDKNFLDATAAMLTPGLKPVKAGPEDAADRARELWHSNHDLMVALVDLHMPQSGKNKGADLKVGIDLIREMKESRPGARIAANSALEGHDALAEAVRAQADAFIGKDWERAKVLDNVQCLWGLITAGSAFQALSAAIDATAGDVIQRSVRVGDWCRLLIIHLESANPKNFDLASCLFSAHLLGLGGNAANLEDPVWGQSVEKEQKRDQMERQWQFLQKLKPLGREFETVTEILGLRRRCFDTPKAPFLVDFPEGDEPRKHKIPHESRVLSVAAAIDALTAGWPQGQGLDFPHAEKLIQSEASLGKFDPNIVAALNKAFRLDRNRVTAIVDASRRTGTTTLKLTFSRDRITVNQMQQVLHMVERASFDEGHELEFSDFAMGKRECWLTISGASDSVQRMQERLERRQTERNSLLGSQSRHDQPPSLISEFHAAPDRIEILPIREAN